jgi:hypothetical protein
MNSGSNQGLTRGAAPLSLIEIAGVAARPGLVLGPVPPNSEAVSAAEAGAGQHCSQIVALLPPPQCQTMRENLMIPKGGVAAQECWDYGLAPPDFAGSATPAAELLHCR